MNILVPDIWLRTFLKTKATPLQLKEYLSLCGPSVERIHGQGKDTIYDIEITGNRPDTMSVVGVAREAAAILPRFDVKADLIGDPYISPGKKPLATKGLPLRIKTDPALNPRWTSVVIDNVNVGKSPAWLAKWLELAGMRSLNNVIDVTNFLMRSYGQPAHVFDYDRVAKHTMILRESRKGEKLVTLDGKSHRLPGGDIVIEDGDGKLIDLCGIMGGQNSAVSGKTTKVLLFLQTYDPAHIRKTSMALSHRTEAAGLFEKGTDTELVMPVFLRGIELMHELTGGKIASQITDIYPKPYKAPLVSVARTKVESYVGNIADKEIIALLTPLGFPTTVTQESVEVRVPSFRRDVTIDVDIIEEIARIYGYQRIPSSLPASAPPVVSPAKDLLWEEEIKVRLRDWGYTELYTYSMISEKLMQDFGLATSHAYVVANPLSEDWKYMRPSLLPSMLDAINKNKNLKDDLMLFELSMIYQYRKGDVPKERPTLIVAATGPKFSELKGLAEALFKLMGIALPPEGKCKEPFDWYNEKHLDVGDFGVVGEIRHDLLSTMGVSTPLTVLDLDIAKLIEKATTEKKFVPIPKYPPIIEDLSFTVPPQFMVGPLIAALSHAHPKIANVTLLSTYENTRTFHITYLDPGKNLTDEEIIPIREKLIELARRKFGVTLKTS